MEVILSGPLKDTAPVESLPALPSAPLYAPLFYRFPGAKPSWMEGHTSFRLGDAGNIRDFTCDHCLQAHVSVSDPVPLTPPRAEQRSPLVRPQCADSASLMFTLVHALARPPLPSLRLLTHSTCTRARIPATQTCLHASVMCSTRHHTVGNAVNRSHFLFRPHWLQQRTP